MEIRIRRLCSEPEPQDTGPLHGQEYFWKCRECGAYTYARDGQVFHEPVEEWATLEEFRSILSGVTE